jgi:hypothetical protein
MFFPSRAPNVVNISNEWLRSAREGNNEIHQAAERLAHMASLRESGVNLVSNGGRLYRLAEEYDLGLDTFEKNLTNTSLDPTAANQDGLTPLQLTLRKDIEPSPQKLSILSRLWKRFTFQESYPVFQKPTVGKLRQSTLLIAKKILEKPLLLSRPEPPPFSLFATYDTYERRRNLYGRQKTNKYFRENLIPDFFKDTEKFNYAQLREYNTVPQHPIIPSEESVCPGRIAYHIANSQIKELESRYEKEQYYKKIKMKIFSRLKIRSPDAGKKTGEISPPQKERLTELFHKIRYPQWWHWILPPLRLQGRNALMKEEQLKRFEEAKQKWDSSFVTTST